MIKHYSIFAKWRKKDVAFLNTLNLNRVIEEGYFGFSIEEGITYNKILNHYSKNDTAFNKTKPPEFSINLGLVTFSKEELDRSMYYAMFSIPPKEVSSSRFPQPNKKREYVKQVFEGFLYKYGEFYGVNCKKQIAPFKIKKPKWKKEEICFNLGLEYEYTLFKRDFYQEVLAPLGIDCMEVLDYKTGEPLEDTVQLVVPVAKSKLLLENSAYDIYSLGETNGFKQYGLQTLDFFPPFEKEFNFQICYSQEYFYGGFRKIIISKEFCNLLLKHKIIEYDTNHLIPLKYE
ncbi:hypothetical protein ACQY1Q_10780 [Tenacibaculum sp. TC6]|uniref:hypothetical protein n=1 Tax=Tenacibaculum sp. TC6 TaxID=3423223 RepID=UPI003D36E7C9